MEKQPWDSKGIINKFEAHRNMEVAAPMADYMRNQFAFLGIKTPLRKALLNQQFREFHLPERRHLTKEMWELYELPEREPQYAAIDLLEK